MNFLIYDEPRALSELVRSVIVSSGHRVSISSEPRDAILRLDTGLFDAVVVGPGGTHREVADYLNEEMLHLPVILLGRDEATPGMDRIHAVLASPLNLGAFVAAVRRIESVEESGVSGVPVSIRFEDGTLGCTADRVTRRGMILEPSGSREEFHGFFAPAHGREFTAVFGEERDNVFSGRVKYVERGPALRVRLVGVTFEDLAEKQWDAFLARWKTPEEMGGRQPGRLRRSG